MTTTPEDSWTTTLLLFAIAPMMGACSSMQHFEWTEDVQLSDGRKIVVQRSEDHRRITDVGAGFQQGLLFQRSGITATLPPPIGRKIAFDSSLSPLALDISPGNAIYLVCSVPTRESELEWKVPREDFYAVFRLLDDTWQRISLADLPVSIQPNLLPSGYGLFVKRELRSGIHVDTRLKNELIAELPPSDRLRTIIRLRQR
jgi:hypothetical protein